jgi:hypothetical protein
MKTLKVLAISIFTLGAVTAAKAQVQVSLSANFGNPGYYPVYEEPVVVERPIIYRRPEVVVVERPVYYRRPVVYHSRPVVYHRRPVVYHRTVVYDRPVHYRTKYRTVKYHRGHGNNRMWIHQKRHH